MTTPTIPEAIAELKRRGACSDARAWLATQPDVVTAWAACERPAWMLWIAVRRGVDRRTIVRIACVCARTSLRFVPAGEDRPLRAIEAAEAWADGRATIQEVRSAAADAAVAAAAAAAAVAAYAAYAADAAVAAYAAARAEANRQMCAIVRQHITLAELLPEVA